MEIKTQWIKLEMSELYWLLGRRSKKSLDNKFLLYKTIFNPYGCMELNSGDVQVNLNIY